MPDTLIDIPTPTAVAPWAESHRFDPDVVPIADRHYNRQRHGTPQFAPPGRCHVLRIGTVRQLAERDSGGAFWVCSAFRNEGAGVAKGDSPN